MKKSSKILGSLAVSAALVMGTAVPAFADTTSDPNVDTDMTSKTGAQTALTQGDDKSQGEGTTTVNISTYTSQISVTVPLSVQFALDTTGGAGYAPTNYKIMNNTVVPVTVEKADISKGDDGKYDFGTTASTVSGGTKVGTGTVGDIYADFTPSISGATHLFLEKDKASQNLGWEIGAAAAAGSTAYKWTYNGTESTFTDLAAAKSAIVNEIGNGSTVNGFSDFSALMNWINQNTTVRGSMEQSNENGTSLTFSIAAASSVLQGADALTENAAKIVYTVKVA